MASPYRDSLEAQRDRIRALDVEITLLEETFTEVFWGEVAPGLALARPTRREPPDDAATPEELMLAATEREDWLTALQRVDRDFASIEEGWTQPPAEPLPLELIRENWGSRVDRAFKVRGTGIKAFTTAVAELAPGTALASVAPDGVGCTVVMGGVAYALTYQGWSTSRSAEQMPLNKVAVRVAPGAAEIRLTPQNFGDEVLAMLRMKQDIPLGHAEFDGYFLIQGDADGARAMLTPSVRTLLLSLAQNDIPWLEVSHGVASIWWFWELTRTSLEAAIEALGLIRDVPPTRALRSQ